MLKVALHIFVCFDPLIAITKKNLLKLNPLCPPRDKISSKENKHFQTLLPKIAWIEPKNWTQLFHSAFRVLCFGKRVQFFSDLNNGTYILNLTRVMARTQRHNKNIKGVFTEPSIQGYTYSIVYVSIFFSTSSGKKDAAHNELQNWKMLV